MNFLRFKDHHLPAFGSNWQRFLAIGIGLVILGIIAISAAVFTTLLSVVFLGVMIFASGGLVALDTVTFWWQKWSGFTLHLIMAILYLIVGFLMMANPVQASVSITLLLGIFYIIAGIFRIVFSPALRTAKWGLLNGIISLILGILILSSWPASSLFIIGLFVGIDLLFAGCGYIMSALAGRALIKK